MARPPVPDSRSRHCDIPTPVHTEVDFQAEYLTLDAVSLRTTRNDFRVGELAVAHPASVPVRCANLILLTGRAGA